MKAQEQHNVEIQELLEKYNIKKTPRQSVTVEAREEAFASFHDAKRLCEGQGITTGKLCRSMPVGCLKGDRENALDLLQKWDRMLPEVKDNLTGVLLSKDFRHGPVHAVFFE